MIASIANIISFTIKVASISSSTFGNNVINYLDAYIILSLFCISPFVSSEYIIISFALDILLKYKKAKKYGGYY